jgi:hypothetical protein
MRRFRWIALKNIKIDKWAIMYVYECAQSKMLLFLKKVTFYVYQCAIRSHDQSPRRHSEMIPLDHATTREKPIISYRMCIWIVYVDGTEVDKFMLHYYFFEIATNMYDSRRRIFLGQFFFNKRWLVMDRNRRSSEPLFGVGLKVRLYTYVALLLFKNLFFHVCI